MHLFVFADDCVEKHCPQGLWTNHAYLVIIRWMRSQQSTQTPPFCLATLCHLNKAMSCFSSCAPVTLNPKLIFLVENIYPLLLVQKGIANLGFCLQSRKRVLINAFTVRDQCISKMNLSLLESRYHCYLQSFNGVMFCRRNVVKTWLDWNWQLETCSATNLCLAKDMNVHEDARIECEELKIVQLIYFHLLV